MEETCQITSALKHLPFGRHVAVITDARFSGVSTGACVLAARSPRPDLAPDPDFPDDTRLWAALQRLGGGTWGGCVYDVDTIIAALERGPVILNGG
jgi:hypothetical protein